MENEIEFEKVKEKIVELINEGKEQKEIVEYFKDDIDNKRISQAVIYKYYNIIKGKQLSLWIKQYAQKKELSEEAKFILPFLIKWSEAFTKETDDIFNNSKITKKIIALEPYLKNLERVYSMITNILPTKSIEKGQIYSEQNIPIKMPKEEKIDE